MKKEFILSLKKLNFIVLKKIAQKRGYGVEEIGHCRY